MGNGFNGQHEEEEDGEEVDEDVIEDYSTEQSYA